MNMQAVIEGLSFLAMSLYTCIALASVVEAYYDFIRWEARWLNIFSIVSDHSTKPIDEHDLFRGI